MNVLRAIRRCSAAMACATWLATVSTAVSGVFAPTAKHARLAITGEILFGSVAMTATVVYVIALMTDHFDDTQWNVGYTERLIQRPRPEGPQPPGDLSNNS